MIRLSQTDGEEPQIALTPLGAGMAVWQRFDGLDRLIDARRSPSPAPRHQADASPLFERSQHPDVAIDHDDNAVATWLLDDGSPGFPPCCDVVQTRTISATGTLGTTHTLSATGQHANAPQVASDSAGDSTIAWFRSDGTNDRIEAVQMPPAGHRGRCSRSQPPGSPRSPQPSRWRRRGVRLSPGTVSTAPTTASRAPSTALSAGLSGAGGATTILQ